MEQGSMAQDNATTHNTDQPLFVPLIGGTGQESAHVGDRELVRVWAQNASARLFKSNNPQIISSVKSSLPAVVRVELADLPVHDANDSSDDTYTGFYLHCLEPGTAEILINDVFGNVHPFTMTVIDEFAESEEPEVPLADSVAAAPLNRMMPSGTVIKKVTPFKDGFKVKWVQPDEKVDGYQIEWSDKPSLEDADRETVRRKSKGGQKCRLKVRDLYPGVTYFVQMRTYKKVKVNGKADTFYSPWSPVVSITIEA